MTAFRPFSNGCDIPYKLQRTLLAPASHWFAKSFTGDMIQEDGKLEIRLHDTSPEAFENFLYRLFCKEVPNPEYEIDLAARQAFAVLLWLFADSHFLASTKNAAIVQLHHTLDTQHSILEIVQKAFECSPPGSPLRRIMLRDVVARL